MIICFTGTGNSAAVASVLSRHLGDDEVVMLSGALLCGVSPSVRLSGNRIVWVFPTYSWGVPPVVAGFIKHVTITGAGGAGHFMVTTCGDDVGRIDSQWRRMINRRGWKAKGVWSVQMPNTYVCMKGFDVDYESVAHAKLEAMPARVKHIAAMIAAGSDETDVVAGSWSGVKTGVIYQWFRRYAMSPKPFRASEACIGCGRCARECPTCNITLDATTHRPVWGSDCALCLRCYHYCPVRAIDYGKSTAGKGQYRCPDDAGIQG